MITVLYVAQVGETLVAAASEIAIVGVVCRRFARHNRRRVVRVDASAAEYELASCRWQPMHSDSARLVSMNAGRTSEAGHAYEDSVILKQRCQFWPYVQAMFAARQRLSVSLPASRGGQ
jgi:hypothetical protein